MDELVARYDVAQLIRPAELHAAAVVPEEVVEVVGLQHLVEELGQAHALGALEATLHAQAAQQRAHAEVAAHGGQEVHEVLLLEPGGVVEHREGAPGPAVAEEARVVGGQAFEPPPQGARVGLHALGAQRLPPLASAAGVPQAGRGAPHERNGVVAGSLEVEEPQQGQQVAHVQRVARGVEAAVHRLGRRARPAAVEEFGELCLRAGLGEELFEQAASPRGRQHSPRARPHHTRLAQPDPGMGRTVQAPQRGRRHVAPRAGHAGPRPPSDLARLRISLRMLRRGGRLCPSKL